MTGELYMLPGAVEMQLEKVSSESEAYLRSPEYKAKQSAEIAQMCREWRAKADIPASRAAQILGIPKRTYEGIEQGRGFPYPMLLTLAIKAFD